ncbi:MAG: protein-disulfide reductase DsbD N-terminal domain-containing protein [Gemmataceae bacterium]
MHSTLSGFVIAFGVVLSLAPWNACQAQFQKGETSPSKIKVTVKAGERTASGRQQLAITIKPAKSWYIYANPVGNKFFETNATKISIKGKSGPKLLKIEYPKGKLVKDDIVGNYNIYAKAVTVKAVIQRSNNAPFDLNVMVQSCSKNPDGSAGLCLPPGTKTVTVK